MSELDRIAPNAGAATDKFKREFTTLEGLREYIAGLPKEQRFAVSVAWGKGGDPASHICTDLELTLNASRDAMLSDIYNRQVARTELALNELRAAIRAGVG